VEGGLKALTLYGMFVLGSAVGMKLMADVPLWKGVLIASVGNLSKMGIIALHGWLWSALGARGKLVEVVSEVEGPAVEPAPVLAVA